MTNRTKKINSGMLKAATRETSFQGVPVYIPVLEAYEGGRLIWSKSVHPEAPLVSQASALKYAQIAVNDIYEHIQGGEKK